MSDLEALISGASSSFLGGAILIKFLLETTKPDTTVGGDFEVDTQRVTSQCYADGQEGGRQSSQRSQILVSSKVSDQTAFARASLRVRRLPWWEGC